MAFLVRTFNATMCFVLSSRARYTLPSESHRTEQVSHLHEHRSGLASATYQTSHAQGDARSRSQLRTIVLYFVLPQHMVETRMSSFHEFPLAPTDKSKTCREGTTDREFLSHLYA